MSGHPRFHPHQNSPPKILRYRQKLVFHLNGKHATVSIRVSPFWNVWHVLLYSEHISKTNCLVEQDYATVLPFIEINVNTSVHVIVHTKCYLCCYLTHFGPKCGLSLSPAEPFIYPLISFIVFQSFYYLLLRVFFF